MRNPRPAAIVAVVLTLMCVGFSVNSMRAAEHIGGTISATRVLTTDSELVSDVTCTVTGAPGISLKLNGFR